MEPAFLLDAADEEGTDAVCISVHCGQGLDYARQISAEAAQRGKSYRICMGGTLNAMLPGNSEPIDVTELIKELGVCASNDFEEQIAHMTLA